MQGGTLNAEEDDFNTAFSYFFEAYGGYADLDEPVEGERSVKYVMEGMKLNDVLGGALSCSIYRVHISIFSTDTHTLFPYFPSFDGIPITLHTHRYTYLCLSLLLHLTQVHALV